MKENATAETTVESWVSQRDQAKAQLELAQINLGYTEVRAPFEGRLGARQVDPGNLVGSSGPTVLATIEQLHPIYVNFNVNERDALHLRQEMRRLKIELGSNIGKAPVEVGLQNEEGYPHVGRARLRRQRALDLDGDDRTARPLQERGHDALPGPLRPRADPPGRPAADARDPAERRRQRPAGRLRLRREPERRRRAQGDREGAPHAIRTRDPKRRRRRRPRDRQRPAQRARRREGRADHGAGRGHAAAGLRPRARRQLAAPCWRSFSSSVRSSRT